MEPAENSESPNLNQIQTIRPSGFNTSNQKKNMIQKMGHAKFNIYVGVS